MLFFLNAPHGSGKTRFLSPKIKELAVNRDWQTAYEDLTHVKFGTDIHKGIFDIDKFRVGLGQLPKVKDNSTGVIILDEAGWIMTGGNLTEILKFSEGRGYKKSILIPAGKDNDVREKLISDSRDALNKAHKTSQVYQMDRKVIPEHLSREYLELLGVPEEVIEFAVSTYPLYLGVLDLVGVNKTVESARKNVYDLWPYRFPDIAKEIFDIEEKIENRNARSQQAEPGGKVSASQDSHQ